MNNLTLPYSISVWMMTNLKHVKKRNMWVILWLTSNVTMQSCREICNFVRNEIVEVHFAKNTCYRLDVSRPKNYHSLCVQAIEKYCHIPTIL